MEHIVQSVQIALSPARIVEVGADRDAPEGLDLRSQRHTLLVNKPNAQFLFLSSLPHSHIASLIRPLQRAAAAHNPQHKIVGMQRRAGR